MKCTNSSNISIPEGEESTGLYTATVSNGNILTIHFDGLETVEYPGYTSLNVTAIVKEKTVDTAIQISRYITPEEAE